MREGKSGGERERMSQHLDPKQQAVEVENGQFSNDKNKQIQRQPPAPANAARQHQVRVQRPMASPLPQANRQPEDEPPRRLRADGPALPAHEPHERRPQSRRQSTRGDAESGAGRESSFPPSLPSIYEISLAVLSLTFAIQYLYFPCGIIRGALAGLGMDVTVHADSSEIPAATFQIKTRGAKA